MANQKHLKNLLSNKENQNILIYVLSVIIFSLLLLLLHSVFTKVGEYDVSFTQYAPMLSLVLLLAIRHKDRALRSELTTKFTVDLRSVIYSVIVTVVLAIAPVKRSQFWETPFTSSVNLKIMSIKNKFSRIKKRSLTE